MELSGYFGILRRWWWTLVVAIWVAGLAGFLLGSQIAPTYETRTRLLVGPINTDIETLRAAGQLVQTYSALITSEPLLEAVSRDVGLTMTTSELRSRIRSTADEVTRLLTVRVTDEDPERAVAIASALGEQLTQLAAGVTRRPEGELLTVDRPEPPTDPIAPQLSLIVLLAGLGGLVAAIVAVLLLEYLSDSLRSREDLEHLVPAPFLGKVSLEESLTARTQRRLPPDGPTAATYRQLLPKMERSISGPVRTLAIVGPARQGAVSDAVVAIALALGEVSPQVTVVDVGGDLSVRLGLDREQGLRDWLLDLTRSPDELGFELTRNVAIIPVGSGGAIESMTPAQMTALRDHILSRGGTLVVAIGSLESAPAGVVPAEIADAVIVVAVRDRTHRADLRRTGETLRLIGARLAGSMLMEPGDRTSRHRAATVRPAEAVATAPVAPLTGTVIANPEPPTAGPTRRRRRLG